MLNIILLPLLSLFLSDFFMIWLILEISNFFFICSMNFSMLHKKMIFFYFMIQVMASFTIMMTLMFNSLLFKNNFTLIILILALMLKLSIPPMHLWLPLIMKFLPWKIMFILLTFQKIIPFYLLSLLYLPPLFIFSSILLCSILPPYNMLNLTNFKLLLAYSSINQSSWMILLISMKNIIWFKYFLFYSFISLSIFSLFHLSKMFMSSNYFPSQFKFNTLFTILMMNMSGLPPFSFFYMKWYSLFIFLKSSNLLIILMIMMISSLLMLYIYVNMSINFFFLMKFKSKLINLNFSYTLTILFLTYLTLFFSSILFIF
uniref:NADH-ubiquinone oxidoreductase chain 2 n=1 Tax=Pheidole oxyops TaxID=615297 RepID=A0A343YVP1_9HYME|nr:NADH dehydrogenase subunit 2 [Pheidole oxyops]